VIGAGELGQRVIETVDQHRELGFRVVGVLTRKPEKVGGKVNGVPVVGVVGDVDKHLDSNQIDQVIIALAVGDQVLVKDLIEMLALRTVDVKVVPDLYQYI